MTRFKFLQITSDNLTSFMTILVLCVQVVLLVLLSNKIGRLEKIFSNLSGGNASPSVPIVVERTPDERGQAIGPNDAKITIVEFSDFECPYCADAAIKINEILAKYPQVRFVYRHFPLTGIHSNAFGAAEATECAGEQGKFWEMHDTLFANQFDMGEKSRQTYAVMLGLNMDQFNDCLTSGRMRTIIEQDIADGEKYGVNVTPTFFVNNVMYLSLSDLEVAVQEALTKP